MWAKKSIKSCKQHDIKYTYASLYVRAYNRIYNLLTWLKRSPVLTQAVKEPQKNHKGQDTNEPISLIQEYKAWLFIQRIGSGAEQEIK